MTKKPPTVTISDALWKDTQHETVERIFTLLDSAEKLLQNKGNLAVCAGLYTYAVEEYGKLLFLQEDVPQFGKVTVTYKREFCWHPAKIPKALSVLPPECKFLKTPLFDPAIFDPNIFDAKLVKADFEARTTVFYTDFNDTYTALLSPSPVDGGRLLNAIIKLRQIVSGIKI